jgi:hypothetical protein
LKDGDREEGMEDNNDEKITMVQKPKGSWSTRRQHVLSLLREEPPFGSPNRNQNHRASRRP